MVFVPKDLAGCNYPIETDIQKKFWGSRHKCNRAKAIIAFSYDKHNAMNNMQRIMGWRYFWRERAWNAFGHFVNTPDMGGIPFSEGSTAYWECMPNIHGSSKIIKDAKPNVRILTQPTSVTVGDTIPITAYVAGHPYPTIEWKVSENGKERILPNTSDSISYKVKEAGTLIVTCIATNRIGTTHASVTYNVNPREKRWIDKDNWVDSNTW